MLVSGSSSRPRRKELPWYIINNLIIPRYQSVNWHGILVHQTPEVNRKIVIKLDAYVLSIMFFTSILQFLDKTALNYANLFGIGTDLGLSGSEYSWLASLFYLGYLIAQFPASYLFSKFPTGKLLGVCIILWGITILVFTWSSNFTGLFRIQHGFHIKSY